MLSNEDKFEILFFWENFQNRIQDNDTRALFEEWYDGQEALEIVSVLLDLTEQTRYAGQKKIDVSTIEAALSRVVIEGESDVRSEVA